MRFYIIYVFLKKYIEYEFILFLFTKNSKDDIVVKLGERIVQLRKEKGIKQIDLSVYINIDDGSLRKVESGKANPTTKTLEKIAQGLGVKVKDLFDFE